MIFGYGVYLSVETEANGDGVLQGVCVGGVGAWVGRWDDFRPLYAVFYSGQQRAAEPYFSKVIPRASGPVNLTDAEAVSLC